MLKREYVELEQVLKYFENLNELKWNNQLYEELRMDIIHAQICLA